MVARCGGDAYACGGVSAAVVVVVVFGAGVVVGGGLVSVRS